MNLPNMFNQSKRMLIIVCWTSAIIFGVYILGFYLASYLMGNLENWNLGTLPGLYDSQNTKSTFGMGLHFAAGGLILVLGCIQLLQSVRINYPAWHRWIGRIYVVSCLATAIGGIFFILFKGTVGGLSMDIGFGFYGVLMFISAILTWKHAANRNIELHRAWALRLFILAIGSWLYRIETGLARIFLGSLGHTKDFQGTTDMIMNFFFYVPNLILLEIYLKCKWTIKQNATYVLLIIIIWICTFLVAFATYFLLFKKWIPNLSHALG